MTCPECDTDRYLATMLRTQLGHAEERAREALEILGRLRAALQEIASLPAQPLHGDTVDCPCQRIALDALDE
jgi:hypothetical protein